MKPMFEFAKAYPFKFFGLTGSFWTVHIDVLIWTWGAMAALGIFILICRYYARKEQSLVKVAYEELFGFFLNLCQESFIPFNLNYFTFTVSLFLFTVFCSLIGLIPLFDEAVRDLNTTLALALASFVYVHYQKIKCHGSLEYLKEYIEPFFLLAPINLIGELGKITSMTFRLFGNILGGSIILSMVVELFSEYKFVFLPLVALVILFDLAQKYHPALKEKRAIGWAMGFISVAVFSVTYLQFFFGVFEGLVQAFVLTMLTITHLAMGAQKTHESSQDQGALP